MELKHSENYYVRLLLNKVMVKDIMTTRVISLRVDEPFSHVEEKFREHHIRHLPVVDNELKLVGIITQRDLYRIHSPKKDGEGNWYYDKNSLDQYILRHVMTKDPFFLKPADTVGQALVHIVEEKYGCIPIADDSRLLVGIITQIDILRIAAQIMKEGNASDNSR